MEVSAVLSDGNCMGHVSCQCHNCQTPLAKNNDWFCPNHAHLAQKCAVIDCSASVVTTSDTKHTCEDLEHQALECQHVASGKAQFKLKDRLKKARIINSMDLEAVSNNVEFGDIDEDEHRVGEEIVVELDLNGRPRSEENIDVRQPDKKLKIKMGRGRTHNEQLLVVPCGIIIASTTFYGAEAIPSVVVSANCFVLFMLFMLYRNSLRRHTIPFDLPTISSTTPTVFFPSMFEAPKTNSSITLVLLLMFFISTQNTPRRIHGARSIVTQQHFQSSWLTMVGGGLTHRLLSKPMCGWAGSPPFVVR